MDRQGLIRTSGLVVLLAIMVTGGGADAQTTANGPYYAWPSWDQTLPSSTRFIVLSNFSSQAVLDRETGLVWQRSPSSSGRDWGSASLDCILTTTGNRAGWRLPTINELGSLFDPSVTARPNLPSGHPFTGLPLSGNGAFWTLTPIPTGPGHFVGGFLVSVGGLRQGALQSDSAEHYVWCVRGGVFGGPQGAGN